MDQLEELLSVASDAARAGGQVAEAHRGEVGDWYYSWKGSRDPFVSQSMVVQNTVIEAIQQRYPDAAILAEEGPEDEPLPVDADPLWLIDPICGSLNYLQGSPLYGVSVAVRVGDTWQIGVVHEPARDRLYSAIEGRTAYVNGEALNVEQFGDGTEAINRSVVGFDWPGATQPRNEMLSISSTLAPNVLSLRSLGSPALSLCYLAAGHLHGYVGLDLKAWDVVAGTLILQGAGGTVTNFNGASWMHTQDGGYVASNSIIHGRLLQATLLVLTMRSMTAERIAEAAKRQATVTQAPRQPT
jgi:myo-inositol-1(or 4)-monophosphatase